MKKGLDIEFRNVQPTEQLERIIRKKIGDLERIYPRLTACRVMVELPHRHHKNGNLYHVVINVGVPEDELVVDNAHNDDRRLKNVTTSINDAFSRAKRQLKDFSEKQRGIAGRQLDSY